MATSYSAVIDVRVNGLNGVQTLEDKVAAISRLTKQLKPIPSLFDKRGGTSDQALKANKLKRELSDLVKKYADGNTTSAKFSSTIAGVNNQLRNFNSIAANSSVKSTEFTNALRAAANASGNLLSKELARFNALRNIYERQPGAGKQDVSQYGVSGVVKNLLDLRKEVPNSIGALEAYQSELKDVQRLVDQTSQEFRELGRAIREVDTQLGKGISTSGFPSSPIRGSATTPGSPLFLEAQQKRRRERLSGVALGAGFPLLFGGGPGAVLGGAAGGLVGGPAGFAAQIALSAIGQQFDKLGAQAVKVGQALNPLTFDLDTFAGAAGIAGTEAADFLAKIEQFGGKAEAAKEATKLLARRIGTDATNALEKFGKDAQEVGNQISIIFTKVLAAIAAAAGPLLASLGAGLTRINQLGGFQERKGLTGADLTAQQFLTRTGRLQRTQQQKFAVGLGLESTATVGQIRKAAEARAIASQKTFETSADKELELRAAQLEAASKKPKRAGRAKGEAEAEREAARVAKALINQRAITLEVQRQSEFSAQIATAKLAKNETLVRELQGEQKLAELGIKTAKDLELEKDSAVQLAIARRSQAEAALINQEVAQDLAQIEADKAETAADLLRNLDYELELNSALTREAQTEVSIKKELDDLRKKGIVDEQTLLAIAERRRQLQEPTQLRDFIRTASDELNNLQITAVNVSNAIGNAIGNSMAQGIERLVEGTQTAQEVFANFLKAIGQALVQEGTKMIATYIAIGIARIFAGFSSPKVDSKGATAIGAAAGGGGGSAFNIGAVAGGLANGGAVRSSTPYLVGERGPELFIPGMNGGVMSNSDLRSAMGAAPGSANGSPTLNMSFETTNIAGVEYVSREQLEAAMVATRRQATRDGAKRGMSMTLDRIQQSPQTRNRLGIG